MEKPKPIEKIAKKPTRGRVKTLYALPYMDCMVYLMQIDEELFHSFAIINGSMSHFYLEVAVPEGKKKHTKDLIHKVVQILLAGAHTSIEMSKGVKQNEKQAGQIEEVLKVAEEAWGDDKPKQS